MTPKETKFCEYYLELGNASEAYRRAFAVSESYLHLRNAACELLKKPCITAAIEAGRAEAAETSLNTREAMIAWYARAATFDPSEIIQHRRGACEHCHGKDHLKQWRLPDYVSALRDAERAGRPYPDIAGGFGYTRKAAPHPDCPKCDGDGVEYVWTADTRYLSAGARAGYWGLKAKKDGIEIIMPDRQKAIENMAKLLGLDTTNVRVSSDIGDLAAAIRLEGVDPNAAAAIYAKLMGGTA